MMRTSAKDFGAMICATLLGLAAADILTSIIYQRSFGLAVYAAIVIMPVMLVVGLPLLWVLRWVGQMKLPVFLAIGLSFSLAGGSPILFPIDSASFADWSFAILAGMFGSLILYQLTAKEGSSHKE